MSFTVTEYIPLQEHTLVCLPVLLGWVFGLFPVGPLWARQLWAFTCLASARMSFGITDLNVKGKMIKLQGENIREYLHDLTSWQGFLHRTQKRHKAPSGCGKCPASLGSSYIAIYKSKDSLNYKLKIYAPDIYTNPRIQSKSPPTQGHTFTILRTLSFYPNLHSQDVLTRL